MSDEFGAIEFPVDPPGRNDSVLDPCLDKIAAYLKAALNFELNRAWSVVNPSVPFVNTASTNDPADGTFNERDLPGLFVTRLSSVDSQTTDDWTETVTDIRVLWVPQNAVQADRARRAPGVNGLQKVITRALARGRHPAWFDAGDTEPLAATLGSVLMNRAQLFRWPFVVSCREQDLTIETDARVPRKYSGYVVMMRISEITNWDPALRGTPIAVDHTTTQQDTDGNAGLELEELIPTTL